MHGRLSINGCYNNMKNHDLDNAKKCYVIIRDSNVPCPESTCRYFLKSNCDLNCAMIGALDGPKTLQEIGDYYHISRMRICQIEKSILNKLRKGSKSFDVYDTSSS